MDLEAIKATLLDVDLSEHWLRTQCDRLVEEVERLREALERIRDTFESGPFASEWAARALSPQPEGAQRG